MTIRRRIDRLTKHGMVAAQDDRRFRVTSAGISALGDHAPQRPAPWVRPELVSAASAKDVLSRSPTDDRTSWARSRHGSEAAAKAAVTARWRKRQPFSTLAEFDRMAG